MGSPLGIHVVCGGNLAAEPVRSNPNITKIVLFANFDGGHLVGQSIASHPYGEACGSHNHRGAVETFVVLGGRGRITVGDITYTVRVDDCVVVPPGVMHNVIGDSEDEPFRVLCTLGRAPGHENDNQPWAATE